LLNRLPYWALPVQNRLTLRRRGDTVAITQTHTERVAQAPKIHRLETIPKFTTSAAYIEIVDENGYILAGLVGYTGQLEGLACSGVMSVGKAEIFHDNAHTLPAHVGHLLVGHRLHIRSANHAGKSQGTPETNRHVLMSINARNSLPPGQDRINQKVSIQSKDKHDSGKCFEAVSNFAEASDERANRM